MGTSSLKFFPFYLSHSPLALSTEISPVLNIQTSALSLYSDVWRLYGIGSGVIYCRGADGCDDGGADSESGVG